MPRPAFARGSEQAHPPQPRLSPCSTAPIRKQLLHLPTACQLHAPLSNPYQSATHIAAASVHPPATPFTRQARLLALHTIPTQAIRRQQQLLHPLHPHSNLHLLRCLPALLALLLLAGRRLLPVCLRQHRVLRHQLGPQPLPQAGLLLHAAKSAAANSNSTVSDLVQCAINVTNSNSTVQRV